LAVDTDGAALGRLRDKIAANRLEERGETSLFKRTPQKLGSAYFMLRKGEGQ
jgi:hypothetical protein